MRARQRARQDHSGRLHQLKTQSNLNCIGDVRGTSGHVCHRAGEGCGREPSPQLTQALMKVANENGSILLLLCTWHVSVSLCAHGAMRVREGMDILRRSAPEPSHGSRKLSSIPRIKAATMSAKLATNDLETFGCFSANRQYKKGPRVIVSAEGMYYTTDEAERRLDGTSGLWCVMRSFPAEKSRPCKQVGEWICWHVPDGSSTRV